MLHHVDELVILHGESHQVGAAAPRKRKREAATSEQLEKLARERSQRGLRTTIDEPMPPLPMSSFHAKMLLLFAPDRCRFCVFSANLAEVHWQDMNEAIYVQDFPAKDRAPEAEEPLKCPCKTQFEVDLRRFLRAVGGYFEDSLVDFDFSAALVSIVASVPGEYHDPLWGHWRLRKLLKNVSPGGDAVAQFSSLGSVTRGWLQEFTASLGKPAKLALVLPTVEQVRTSWQGWAAGSQLPIAAQHVKSFLEAQWHRWLCPGLRARAMPHSKCYAGHSGAQIHWFVLGSHNLSRAAWGEFVGAATSTGDARPVNPERAEDSSLSPAFRIRNYELSVLFLAQHVARMRPRTSGPAGFFWEQLPRWQAERNAAAIVYLQHVWLPLQVPPQPYMPGDRPWTYDQVHGGVDSLGATVDATLVQHRLQADASHKLHGGEANLFSANAVGGGSSAAPIAAVKVDGDNETSSEAVGKEATEALRFWSQSLLQAALLRSCKQDAADREDFELARRIKAYESAVDLDLAAAEERFLIDSTPESGAELGTTILESRQRLERVRSSKRKAVEEQDFDLAYKLRKHELELVAGLEQRGATAKRCAAKAALGLLESAGPGGLSLVCDVKVAGIIAGCTRPKALWLAASAELKSLL